MSNLLFYLILFLNDSRLLNYLLNVKLNSSQDKDIIQTPFFQKVLIIHMLINLKMKKLKVHQEQAEQEFE